MPTFGRPLQAAVTGRQRLARYRNHRDPLPTFGRPLQVGHYRSAGTGKPWSGRYACCMRIADFKIERYFAKWEFVAPYLLGSSDAETFGLDELLGCADEKS